MKFCLILLLVTTVLRSYSYGLDDAQRFVEQPGDVTVSKGQLIFLNCVVKNLVGPVQWLRDGFGLGVGPTFDGYPRYRVDADPHRGVYNLMLTNIQEEDDAMFECQVGATETTQGLKSRRAKVTVQLPPASVSIDGGPRVQVVAGTTHDLTCRAVGGRPAASISWRRDGQQVSADAGSAATVTEHGSGGTQRYDAVGRLSVSPTRADQDATYTCRATNAALLEPMSTKVTLDVLYAPEVTLVLTPSDQIREFDRIVLTCSADANPQVTGWRWYREDVLIPNENSNRLVIEKVDRTLNGKSLACEAINSVSNTRQSIMITLLYGPQLVTEPVDVAADIGASDVSLSCEVDSNPRPSFTWTRAGTHLPVLGRDSRLVLQGPTTEDSFGFYTCTASVDGYPAITRNVRLMRNGPPHILSSSQQGTRFGDTGAVECAVYSIPKPKYIKWTRDGIPIDQDNTRPRYKVSERDVEDGRISFLVIDTVQDSDFGLFNCTTDNGYGFKYQTIELYKRSVVPIQYILAAVLSGLVLVVVICVVAFVYKRRKSLGSEVGSDSSECRMTSRNKKDALPDFRIDYATSTDTGHPGRSLVDSWKTDMVDGGYYPVPRELVYPAYEYNSWNRPQSSLHRYPHPASIHNDPSVNPIPAPSSDAGFLYGMYQPNRQQQQQQSPYPAADGYRGNADSDLYSGPNDDSTLFYGTGTFGGRRDDVTTSGSYDLLRQQFQPSVVARKSPSAVSGGGGGGVEISPLATNV